MSSNMAPRRSPFSSVELPPPMFFRTAIAGEPWAPASSAFILSASWRTATIIHAAKAAKPSVHQKVGTAIMPKLRM